MDNISKFDILTGKILAKLYEQFPLKAVLSCDDFGIKNPIRDYLENITQDLKADTTELKFFNACVDWLIQNDFILARQNSSGDYYDVILTHKGLKTLKFKPKSLNEYSRQSIGEHLLNAVNIAKDESIKSVVNGLLNVANLNN